MRKEYVVVERVGQERREKRCEKQCRWKSALFVGGGARVTKDGERSGNVEEQGVYCSVKNEP